MSARKLKALVLGYGAREHALAWKIAQSPLVDKLFVAPGNAGTAQIATNVPISDEDIPGLVRFAARQAIDLTVVGTNDPLALGVVDAFQAAGLPIFGPTRAAARLESSKAFAKAFMRRHGIPTPAYETFDDYDSASSFLDTLPPGGVVVKVSGLGKMGLGVSVCDSREEARTALRLYMVDRILGEAARRVIIEERLQGSELSVFALSDGRTAVPLLPVRDHKRVNDFDRGPNTGGMGAYAPPPDVDETLIADVMARIIQPAVDGMRAAGAPYVGVLYAGLMCTTLGVSVLEYNCRFGNPEALVILPLLESDLVEAMLACIEGRLTPELLRWRDETAAAVVFSSPGYPENVRTGLPITGVEEAAALDHVLIFHHGTARKRGRLVTARGRVLSVVATAPALPEALAQAYSACARVSFEGAHYRRDIGLGLKTGVVAGMPHGM